MGEKQKMTPMEQIFMAIFLFFVIPIGGCIWVLWWLAINNVLVVITKEVEGVLMSRSFRARIKNEKIYPMSTFIRWRSKKVVDVVWDDIKDRFTVTESTPFIGVKSNIKFTDLGDNEGLVAWMPPKELDSKGVITNTRMVKIGTLRFELYESTKSQLTKEELFIKVLLPMGLIILAMAMLIFFPKIYEVIISNSTSAFETARSSVFDWLGQNKPVG
jgi:hypothetical protein